MTIALLVVYTVAYSYARLTLRIVHIQNRSEGEHEVLATPDEWDDLLVRMSEGTPVAEAHARLHGVTPVVLNAFFLPLRSIEVAWWNLMK